MDFTLSSLIVTINLKLNELIEITRIYLLEIKWKTEFTDFKCYNAECLDLPLLWAIVEAVYFLAVVHCGLTAKILSIENEKEQGAEYRLVA